MDLNQLAEELNVSRHNRTPELQAIWDEYRPHLHLIVYGTLQPGESNHHLVSPIRGNWQEVKIHGLVREIQFEHDVSYPGFRWFPTEQGFKAFVLHSETLEDHWGWLDEFEGEAYQRQIIPFHTSEGQGLGYVYCVREQYWA